MAFSSGEPVACATGSPTIGLGVRCRHGRHQPLTRGFDAPRQRVLPHSVHTESRGGVPVRCCFGAHRLGNRATGRSREIEGLGHFAVDHKAGSGAPGRSAAENGMALANLPIITNGPRNSLFAGFPGTCAALATTRPNGRSLLRILGAPGPIA